MTLHIHIHVQVLFQILLQGVVYFHRPRPLPVSLVDLPLERSALAWQIQGHKDMISNRLPILLSSGNVRCLKEFGNVSGCTSTATLGNSCTHPCPMSHAPCPCPVPCAPGHRSIMPLSLARVLAAASLRNISAV